MPQGMMGYASDMFGIEKILTIPLLADLSTTGNAVSLVMTEDITITELAFIQETAASAAGAAAVVALKESTTELASLTIPTATAAGVISRQTTITSATAIASGDTLVFNKKTSSGTGKGYFVMKYRPRYVQA